MFTFLCKQPFRRRIKEILREHKERRLDRELFKSWIILRNLVFLFAICVAYPVYGDSPLTLVIPCDDITFTAYGGVPSVECLGAGLCAAGNPLGRGAVFIYVFSNLDCPNQLVVNQVRVNGTVGQDCIFGSVSGTCADTGRPRGIRALQQCCSGWVFDSGPTVFPNNCFLPPVGEEFPSPPPGTIACAVPCYGVAESGCNTPFDSCAYPGTGCPEGYWASGDPSSCCCGATPILIDIDGDGFDLTNAAGGVEFDLNNDGVREHLSWTSLGSNDAWLALDRNGNGIIDGGRELFGNTTPQPRSAIPQGFLALAEFDKPVNGGNGDAEISRNDAVFSKLLLWRDKNHNGFSEPDELGTPVHYGLERIALDYWLSNRRDQYGNRFRYRARAYGSQRSQIGQWAWDVLLVRD